MICDPDKHFMSTVWSEELQFLSTLSLTNKWKTIQQNMLDFIFLLENENKSLFSYIVDRKTQQTARLIK